MFKRRGALLRHDLEKALVPAVIGEDPFRISWLVKKMDDALDGVEEAKAAIEMALWDIVGKALNTPVYNLLGGKVRDRIPLSYSIPFGAPDDMATLAQERVKWGHRTIKVKVGSDDSARDIAAREGGPQGDRSGCEASRRRQHGMADGQAGDRRHPRDGGMRSRTRRAAAAGPRSRRDGGGATFHRRSADGR